MPDGRRASQRDGGETGSERYIPERRPLLPPLLLPLGRPHCGGPKGLVLAAAREALSAASSPVTTSRPSVRPSPCTSVVMPSVTPARTLIGRRNSPSRTQTVARRNSGGGLGCVDAV